MRYTFLVRILNIYKVSQNHYMMNGEFAEDITGSVQLEFRYGLRNWKPNSRRIRRDDEIIFIYDTIYISS